MYVTVIIPYYDQEPWIDKAVESAKEQTVSPNEIIIIDDGYGLERNYACSNINIKIIHQTNKGLPSARNTGIMNSKCGFILPLDADDEIHPEFIRYTIPHMSDSEVGVVYTSVKNIGNTESLTAPAQEIKLENLMKFNQFYYCALIRKQALLECGGYNPKMIHGYEDWDLWIDIAKRGWKFVYVDKPLFHYRNRPGTMIEESDKWRQWNIGQMRDNHMELYYV